MVVGAEVAKVSKSPSYETITIQSGEYLRFDAKGKMPMVVVDLWAKIWQFFEKNSEFKRRYGTDFEIYLGEDEVSIYIGIQ